MYRSDIIVFLGTFLLGIFVGAYLYYVGWQPNFRLDTGFDSTEETALQVIGEQYGICETDTNGCVTFRVTDDRNYRLVYTNTEGSVLNSQEGEVSNTVWEYLVETLKSKQESGELERYPAQAPNCSNENKGMRYQIQISGYGTVVLDECDRNVNINDSLYEALSDITFSIGAF